MMRRDLLFDASSLIYALKLKLVDVLYGNYVQHLTVYEAVNAIWKEACLAKSLTLEEAEELVGVITEVLDYLNMLSIHPHEPEVLRRAVNLELTVYDASYVVLAEKKGLTLVTEDRKLMEKAGKVIRVTSLKNIA